MKINQPYCGLKGKDGQKMSDAGSIPANKAQEYHKASVFRTKGIGYK